MDAGCNHSLGFSLRENPKPKIRMDGRQDVGCNQCWSLREAQTPKGEKSAWMPLL
jgi:hypothetical protein